jgi:hypothetical protein
MPAFVSSRVFAVRTPLFRFKVGIQEVRSVKVRA